MPTTTTPTTPPGPVPIDSRIAELPDGAMHYLIAGAGAGPPIVLIHGYTQTADMWRPLIGALAQHGLVIAPDLPGIGGSAIPAGGLDPMTSAARVHALARSLQLERAQLAGHDIGLMTAYAYAAQFPAEVEQLALLDAFLPGIGDWEETYRDPRMWHFAFHGPTPERLVEGRERIYFEHYWNDFAADPRRSLPEADRARYTAAYARPGRMRAAWSYFAALPATARAFARLAEAPLAIPVLVISGDRAAGERLERQARRAAADVTGVVLRDTGHWLLEERPDETMAALRAFFARRALT